MVGVLALLFILTAMAYTSFAQKHHEEAEEHREVLSLKTRKRTALVEPADQEEEDVDEEDEE